MRVEPVAVVLVVWVFLVIWFVSGLCLFHFYLVIKNRTTNEQLRGMHEFGSVYSIGLLGNIKHMCCTVPVSSVHIHHKALKPTKESEEIQKQIVLYVNHLGSRTNTLKKQLEFTDIMTATEEREFDMITDDQRQEPSDVEV